MRRFLESDRNRSLRHTDSIAQVRRTGMAPKGAILFFFLHLPDSEVGGWSGSYLLENDMKRPKKSLQPLVLVIQDCLLRARSLASVNPIVR